MATQYYCKVCENPARSFFNIGLKRVAVCETCAESITMQQVNWWADKSYASRQTSQKNPRLVARQNIDTR